MHDQLNHAVAVAVADVNPSHWRNYVPKAEPAPEPANDWTGESTAAEAAAFVSAERTLFEERGCFGTVYVLYLGDFFRALGGRTDRLANSLHLMADALLRDRIGSRDSYTFHSPDVFLIRLQERGAGTERTLAESLVDALGARAVGDRYIPWSAIHERRKEAQNQ